MKKRIYISLPIAGKDRSVVEKTADDVAGKLTALGFDVFNPLRKGIDWDAPREVHIKEDLLQLLECDAIYLCDGWQRSRGCSLEHQAAEQTGLVILHHDMSEPGILTQMGAKLREKWTVFDYARTCIVGPLYNTYDEASNATATQPLTDQQSITKIIYFERT